MNALTARACLVSALAIASCAHSAPASTTTPSPTRSTANTPATPAQVHQAQADAQVLRSASLLYLADAPDGCPTTADLIRAGTLDGARIPRDPWGNEYVIGCTSDDVVVFSRGPDAAAGTADDVR